MSFDLSQPEIMKAIYRTILAAYTEPPLPDLPTAQQDRQVFINHVWPGSLLDEEKYQMPWTPDNKNGSQIATEYISNLVNPIPLLHEMYTQSGSLVENLYQFILMASPSALVSTDVPDALATGVRGACRTLNRIEVDGPKNDASRKLVDHSPDDRRISDLERQYADASANLIANRSQYNLSEPIEKREWEQIAPKFEAAVRSAWKLLSKNKPKALFAERSSDNPVARILNDANAIFTSSKLSSVTYPTLTYHPSYVSPDNFSDPDTAASWPFVPSIKVTTSGGTEPSLSISFRFCRLDIHRPWLIASILNMRGWKIQGQPAGSLSNGKAENNSGSFPLLPEHFVVARDLRISGVGENSGEEYYFAKGLQILAWVSRVNPFIPPDE